MVARSVVVTIGFLVLTPLSSSAAEETPKVSGGESFQIEVPYDKAYDTCLNVLKRLDKTIESASKETGQILTMMDIGEGGFVQTGKQIKITVIKDTDTQSTIRVLATVQKRVSGRTVHPWREAKVDEKETASIASEVRSTLAPTAPAKK
ncbi:MAG TPA: hypothetical protein VK392_05345 [Thermoanaerobaculia bacterium]|jgi:hypothetical protein|nr:hypothetical protein [Thermoanaerobaculia bacterium]